MLFVTITAVGGFVAFFFYHRMMVTKLEQSLMNFEAELDYIEDVLQTVRIQITEVERVVFRRSRVKPAVKSAKKAGRPMNPNSARQKKLNAVK